MTIEVTSGLESSVGSSVVVNIPLELKAGPMNGPALLLADEGYVDSRPGLERYLLTGHWKQRA